MFANFLESRNLHHDINPSISSYIPKKRKSGLMESYIVGQQLSQLSDVLVLHPGAGGDISKKYMSKK